ncbi:MAG: hypothetical protein EOM18_11660 [Clostridia bacterium]|nr:hypothetical protein [Clostridia bacterium]
MNESSGDIMQDQEKIEDVMETLSGGAAYYRWNGEKMQTLSYSKGIPLLSGHSEEEYGLLVKENALAIIYEADRKRIQDILLDSVERKKEIVCSFRALHKNGSLIWLNATARVEETDGGIFYPESVKLTD